MKFKQDLPTYNATIYWRNESLEREKRRGLNKKMIPEFMIHALNSVRITIDTGSFDVSMHHCLHCIPSCQSNRFIILLLQVEKETRVFLKKCMFTL
jgi:hypothetical protein